MTIATPGPPGPLLEVEAAAGAAGGVRAQDEAQDAARVARANEEIADSFRRGTPGTEGW